MTTKTPAPKEESKLPTSLTRFKPSKAILRHIRRWMAEFPEDTCPPGLSEERRLELRFGLVVRLAYGAYHSNHPGEWKLMGLPPLSSPERKEVHRLFILLPFGPQFDNPKLSYLPLNDLEEMYSQMIQAEAKAGGFLARVLELVPHALRGRKVLNAAKTSGKQRASEYAPRVNAALQALEECCRKNPAMSVTAARERVAAKYGLSRKTLERHAKRK